jgi:hypothetical protein
MNPISCTLKNYFVEPLQKSGLFTLTRQQQIIGAVALAVFSLIAIGCFLWQRSKKNSATLTIIPEAERISFPTAPLIPPAEITLPQVSDMSLAGIPNLGSTCFINSAVMSLYPLREHLAHLNSPVLKVIRETYENPVLKAPELVSLLREFYQMKHGLHSITGDSHALTEMILKEMIREDPNLKGFFSPDFGDLKCGPCDRKIGFQIITFYLNGENKIFSLNQYLNCPSCNSLCGTIEDILLPKYCLIDLNGDGMNALQETFVWQDTKYKVIAAVKGDSGHANCVIKKEDGNWYLYDDSYVSPANPFIAAGYSQILLEKIINPLSPTHYTYMILEKIS